MKKILSVLLCILLLWSPLIHTQAQEPVLSNSCHSLQAPVSLGGSEQMLDSAQAALLYELNSDTLIYSWNPDQRIDPTGLVKFMTVLVALENGNLSDLVTVNRSALNSVEVGAVSAQLQPGETLTLEQLLYCVMVSSANDAAAVIAEHIGGSQAGFVQMMNDKAQQLGCINTHFVDPHGLSASEQYSTARELAVITEAALENPVFETLFTAKEYVVPATELSGTRQLYTTNHMMSSATIKNYVDERVTGGKPAAATLTDRSMICTAEVGNSKYLCVVMSAEAKVSEDGFSVITFGNFEETKALLDFGFQNFVVRQIVDKAQIFDQFGVSGGENDVVVHPVEDVYTALPKDFLAEDIYFSQQVDLGNLKAPLQQGQVLGTLLISYHHINLGQCELVAAYDVPKEGTVIQPADPAQPEEEVSIFDHPVVKWIIWGTAAVIAVAIAVFFVVRLVRSARIKAMHRKRRRARRRSR